MPSKVEHNLQVACIKWFRLSYPKLKLLIFAVPNGGKRNVREAVSLKNEGVTAGVADIIVLIPSKDNHGLLLEFKSPKGRLQESQKLFCKAVTNQGYEYIVVRFFETFTKIIKNQLKKQIK